MTILVRHQPSNEQRKRVGTPTIVASPNHEAASAVPVSGLIINISSSESFKRVNE